MDLLIFIKLPENGLFLLSLMIIVIMATVEIISLLFGFSLSEFVDNILPDFGIEGDFDGIEMESPSPVLDWLNFGKVPFLILIILFLSSYGLWGYGIQGLIYSIFQAPIPLIPISLLTIVPAIASVHFAGNIIHKILPQVETTAVRIQSLIGSIGVINQGTATAGNPTEAKVKDRFGKSHYVRVEPENKEVRLTKGDQVVLVFYEKGIFKAEKTDIDLL